MLTVYAWPVAGTQGNHCCIVLHPPAAPKPTEAVNSLFAYGHWRSEKGRDLPKVTQRSRS